MSYLCPCGKPIETTSADPYVITWYDGEGTIVYAVCQHGVVVIDQRGRLVQEQVAPPANRLMEVRQVGNDPPVALWRDEYGTILSSPMDCMVNADIR